MHGHAGMPQRNKTWALKGGLDIHTKIRYARSAITFFRSSILSIPHHYEATSFSMVRHLTGLVAHFDDIQPFYR